MLWSLQGSNVRVEKHRNRLSRKYLFTERTDMTLTCVTIKDACQIRTNKAPKQLNSYVADKIFRILEARTAGVLRAAEIWGLGFHVNVKILLHVLHRHFLG